VCVTTKHSLKLYNPLLWTTLQSGPDWKRLTLYLGFSIYLLSFFLPAVGPFKGWECAFLALLSIKHDEKVSSLAFFGGLLNPLMIVYLTLHVAGVARRLGTYLAVALLFCLPMTWFAIALMTNAGMSMELRVGHYLWVAGILLVLVPDLAAILQYPEAKIVTALSLAVAAMMSVPHLIALTRHPPSAKDDFFYVVAWNLREPSICGRIDPRAIGRDGAGLTCNPIAIATSPLCSKCGFVRSRQISRF